MSNQGSTITMLNQSGMATPIKKEKMLKHQSRARKRRLSSSASSSHLESQANASWIRQNFCMRECMRYTPTKHSNVKCCCGKKESLHEDRYLKNPDPSAEWTVATHTQLTKTNAFGEVDFAGHSNRMAKYVRVDYQTPPYRIMQLFFEHWQLSRPNLLISITGGATKFHMPSRLKDVFRKGLIKAATSTRAWIITGGTNTGVMKHVGEAVRDHVLAGGQNDVIAIGVATWGILQNTDTLTDEKGKFPASYSAEEPAGGLCSLDANHSHFILVDNGTVGQYAVEIELRSRIERALSEMKVGRQQNHFLSVPVVLVVLEGGPGTVETVYRSLNKNTPTVIVAGSGRAADILAFAYDNTPEKEFQIKDSRGKVIRTEKVFRVNAALEKRIAELVIKEFGERNVAKIVNWVKECMEKKNLITVFHVDGKGSAAKDIDLAILHALLKADFTDEDQLRLALAWNRIDIAKSELFTDDKRWMKKFLHEAMHLAISNNQVDFVNLFLENGVVLKEYVTIEELESLYNELKENSLLYEILDKEREKEREKEDQLGDVFLLRDVGHLMETLTDDTYKPLYLQEETKYSSMIEQQQLLMFQNPVFDAGHELPGASSNFGEVCLMKPKIKKKRESPFEDPARELFLYSFLQNRRDMAALFWEKARNSIAAALTASQALKLMAKMEQDLDQRADIAKHADEYEELASGVLNECYKDDEERALLLLITETSQWGCSTCLKLAIKAEDKLFTSNSAVQTLLSTIWYGKVSTDNSTFRILVCAFLPFLSPFLIKFREDECGEEEDNTESEEFLVSIKRRTSTVKKKFTQTKINTEQLSDSFKEVKVDSNPWNRSNGGDNRNGLTSPEPGNHTEEDPYGVNVITGRSTKLSAFKLIQLFLAAPVIKFCHNAFSFLAFLLLFSYVLTVNLKISYQGLSWLEIILIIWVSTLLTEEIRQIFFEETTSFQLKLVNWILDAWNVLDIVSIMCFFIGLGLRLNEPTYDAGRYVWACNIILYYIRLLHVFSVHKELGPKLMMIGKMMVDLTLFVSILSVFLIGYGVATQAILYPNETRPVALIKGVLYKAYFQMYGELFVEELEGQVDSCASGEDYAFDDVRCPVTHWLTFVLLAFYMLLSNVLLLNLLIAMFSYTFSVIQDNTDVVWKFQRYSLIYEYYSRPILVPPFIIFSHLILVTQWIIYKCDWTKRNPVRKLQQSLNEDEKKRLALWEDNNADNYHQKEERKKNEDIDERVKLISERVQGMAVYFEQMKLVEEEENDSGGKPANSSVTSAPAPVSAPASNLMVRTGVGSRLTTLEQQMERTQQGLDWIIQSMMENKMGAKSGPPKLKEIKPVEQTEDYMNMDDVSDIPKIAKSIEELGLMVHEKARSTTYTGCSVKRFPVPDDKVHWDIDFPSYKPVDYTSDVVLANPPWADIDLMAIPKNERPILNYNALDNDKKVSRTSYMGTYEIRDSLPLNPKGRTGMVGRGLLGRFGPNHAADPIVTRWKKRQDGLPMEEDGKKVLEFVAIQRRDNGQWAIPGGMVEPGQNVSSTLKAEFSEEALAARTDVTKEERHKLLQSLEKFFQDGIEIYKGYVDDPRNTDNAWMETVAVNYHDEDSSVTTAFPLHAGDDAQAVRWQRVSSRIPLYASHQAILRRTAEIQNAHY